MSLIDVPGHERFVRHMVAGASGVDGFLLCVAADDGVMPQTREHLAVLGLLGVRDGVVAVTRADLADPAAAAAAVRPLVAPATEVIPSARPPGRGSRSCGRRWATWPPAWSPAARPARRACSWTACSRSPAPARW